jgi:succinate-semialdehyde dehydrogenase/glutarate-semialdehyde dehydrogenase
VSPISGHASAEVDVQGPTQVAACVDRARRAQAEWGALPVESRARVLARANQALLDLQEEFAEVIRRETGKPLLEALAMEIAPSLDLLHYWARRAPRVLADESLPLHLLKTKKLRVSYRPRGVVGVISPWNFPFLLSLMSTTQALVAGNAVVLKPSEWTTQSGLLVSELFQAADLPEGLLQFVTGDGETGAALVEAGVDLMCFTGSVATGRRVAEACGRQLVPAILELGGNDPMIVCADADLERAAAGAVYSAFANSGQVCLSSERVYVIDEVADAFTRKVLERVAELRQGESGEVDIGPLTLASQRAVVERHIEDAVSKGARVLAGGRRNPNCGELFFEPTVISDVHHGMSVMCEETFGPVLPIMRVRDEDEALRLANDSGLGLSASVWTRDKQKGIELAKRLRCGSAVINDCFVNFAMPEAPFGGRLDSGLGVISGEVGLRSFCHPQSIAVDRFGWKREYFWFPYTARKVRALKRATRTIWGTPIRRLFS